ncbi:hypothetical protein ABG067_004723 [Albugo candida]
MKQYSKSMLQPEYEDAIGFSRYVPSSNLSRNRIDRTKQAKLLLIRISVLILKEQMTAGRIILAIMLIPYSVPVPFETLSLFQFAAPSPVVWTSQARGRLHVERNIYNDEIVKLDVPMAFYGSISLLMAADVCCFLAQFIRYICGCDN